MLLFVEELNKNWNIEYTVVHVPRFDERRFLSSRLEFEGVHKIASGQKLFRLFVSSVWVLNAG